MEPTDTKTPEQIEEEKKKEQERRIAHEKECEARPYKLYAGTPYRSAVPPWGENDYMEVCTSTSGFEVFTKDVEVIKSACAQLGITWFRIETNRGNTIFESENFIRQEQMHQKERAEKEAEMIARCESFNALPEVIIQWQLPEGAIVQLKKTGAAEYKAGWSSSKMYRGSVGLELSIPGTMKASSLYPDGWITRDGKIQKKKLREAFASWPAAVVEALIDGGLKTYEEARNNIRRQYGI